MNVPEHLTTLDDARIRAMMVRDVAAIILADAVIANEPFNELAVDYEAASNDLRFADEALSNALGAVRENERASQP